MSQIRARESALFRPSLTWRHGPLRHSSAAHDPLLRGLEISRRKAPDLGRHEMGSQLLRDLSESGIGDDRDLLDLPVVIAHESEVGRHGAQTLPSRKRRDLDDETGQTSGLGDVGVDGPGKCGEVAFRE
jgi:hypothetical protein